MTYISQGDIFVTVERSRYVWWFGLKGLCSQYLAVFTSLDPLYMRLQFESNLWIVDGILAIYVLFQK